MSIVLDLTVPGEPIPKGRPRVGPRGGKTPARTVSAESKIAWLAKEQLMDRPEEFPLAGKFTVFLRFFTKWPDDSRSGPDGDNCEKLILDSLNGIVWHDDRQVCGVKWQMSRGERTPRTEIVIRRREER